MCATKYSQRDEAISLKLVFEYDGACFFGCQLQIGMRTVQGEVEVLLYTKTLLNFSVYNCLLWF